MKDQRWGRVGVELAALSEAEPRGATFGLYSPDPVQGEARKAYGSACQSGLDSACTRLKALEG